MSDSYIITLFISGTLLIMLFAFFVIALVVIQKEKQNRARIEKEAIIANNRQQMLTIRLEVQEEMLNKISRELHDNVGQVLSAANMNLYSLINNPHKKELPDVISGTMELIKRSISDIRDLSHSLNSEHAMRLGLVEVIKKELEYIRHTQKIECEVTTCDDAFFLSRDEELVLYRITQEALNNIIKYAQATKIDIVIACTDKEFSLVINDNGIGFDTAAAHNGIGLTNMRQRANLLNASFNIVSELSVGSSIHLNLANREMSS